MLMGTPCHCGEQFRASHGQCGRSVGALYSSITLGSPAAVLRLRLAERLLGESGSVRLAAASPVCGATALILQANNPLFRKIQTTESAATSRPSPSGSACCLRRIVFRRGLRDRLVPHLLVCLRGAADSFALLLAYYLLALPTDLSRSATCGKSIAQLRLTLQAASNVVILEPSPLFSWPDSPCVVHVPVNSRIPSFLLQRPCSDRPSLLSHAAVNPAKNAGRHLSFLYLSNIAGSTLGSFWWASWCSSLLHRTTRCCCSAGSDCPSMQRSFRARNGPAQSPSGLFATAGCLLWS